MKYQGSSKFTHDQSDKIGVLLTNLGTPDEPTPKSLRAYLKQFLSDPRVIEVPRLLWWLILNVVILRIRPRRSAKAYKTVWTEEGSPLLTNTQNQSKSLSKALKESLSERVVVDFAMRYGNPSIDSVVQKLMDNGVRKLIVLPLYPQYCAATTASTFDALAQDFAKRRWLPDFRFISHYHDHEGYIAILANKITRHWEAHGKPQKLILSYHGVPQRYHDNGDPYFCECHKTTRLIAEKLSLEPAEYITTFQSRVGREEWLKPYTDATLKSLPQEGTTDVQVVCPGFSADCLETIEEIGVENRDYFLESGGEKYSYIPALNADSEHIEMLKYLVEDNIKGWQELPQDERAALAKQKGCS